MKKFASKVVAVVMALVMVMSLASFAFAASDTIKVGVLAPLTGAVAQYGNAVNNGVMMYFEELNANGGINGRQAGRAGHLRRRGRSGQGRYGL